MKRLAITIIMVLIAGGIFAQNEKFSEYFNSVKQQFEDRGYKLASETFRQITDTMPLVSDSLMLEQDHYYNVVVVSDNCSYCILKLFFVDEHDTMHPLEFETTETIDDRFNCRIYKNMFPKCEVGRYVVFITSDIPYDMGLLVYKKRLPKAIDN